MGEFDFTYILPENFEKRVVQYLLQLANRQLAEAFQHCKYEYEDVGLAYYAGLRGFLVITQPIRAPHAL